MMAFFITRLLVDLDTLDEYTGHFDDLYLLKSCWGFFLEYETAEKAVKENWGDMFENAHYNLALIEEIAEGASLTEEEHWFAVRPIIDQEAARELEARKKAWREADFYGKALKSYIGKTSRSEIVEQVGLENPSELFMLPIWTTRKTPAAKTLILALGRFNTVHRLSGGLATSAKAAMMLSRIVMCFS